MEDKTKKFRGKIVFMYDGVYNEYILISTHDKYVGGEYFVWTSVLKEHDLMKIQVNELKQP